MAHYQNNLGKMVLMWGHNTYMFVQGNIEFIPAYLEHQICFLFLRENICCDPSSDSSQGDGSDDGSQHILDNEI